MKQLDYAVNEDARRLINGEIDDKRFGAMVAKICGDGTSSALSSG